MNILLVCTGNTCRSPMAEGILKKLLPQHNISSAGIYTADGLGASHYAIEVSKEIDVDISQHKSRQITEEIINDSDLILCMTHSHTKKLEHVKEKTFTLGGFIGADDEISDPYGGKLDEYRYCRQQLEGLLPIVAEIINDKYMSA